MTTSLTPARSVSLSPILIIFHCAPHLMLHTPKWTPDERIYQSLFLKKWNGIHLFFESDCIAVLHQEKPPALARDKFNKLARIF